MIKIKNKLLLIMFLILFIVLIPNLSNAAKASVGKVSNVSVVSSGTNKIKIKWKKIKKVKGYTIYLYNAKKKKYDTYSTTSNNWIEIKKLKPAEQYKIKVRAFVKKKNKKIYGAYSSILTTATKPEKVKSVSIKKQSESTISLSWSKVAKASGYNIYLYNSSKKKFEFKLNTKGNSGTLTGLSQARKYKFKIKAYKQIGKNRYYGDTSQEFQAKTIPGKVTGVKEYDYSLNSVSITWNKISNEVIYKIYMYNNSKKKYEEKGETKNNYFKISGLNPASYYQLKVRAYMVINKNKYFGGYSNVIDAGTSPNKANGLKISKTTTNSIEIKWNSVKEASGYAVYVYRESYQSFVLYKTTTGTAMSITGLRAAKFYKMYVKAYSTVKGTKYYSAQSAIISSKTNSTDKYKAGIDVSQHQEKIDWDKVKDMGVDFAILRLGWIGNKQNHTMDTYFERNYNECKRLGIPVGVYIYCYSNSVTHIKEGAEWTVKKLKGKTTELPVFIDMEDSSITKAGKKVLSQMCVEYNTIIQNAGYTPGIYANKYWFDTYLEKDLRTKYVCWIAHYTSSSSINYEDTFTIWQYSSAGKVDGIYGSADLNIMYVKEEEVTPDPEPETPTPEEPTNPTPEEPTEPTPDQPENTTTDNQNNTGSGEQGSTSENNG